MTRGEKRIYLIGITGGIGSGKSTVSRFLSSCMNLPLVDIDGICRALLVPERPGWLALRQHLPPSFFTAEGTLDRRNLRRAIFSDAGLRGTVNGLLHPLALIQMKKEAAASGHYVVLVDVPLLYEAGWISCFQRSVVVFADLSACCRRIMERDTVEADEVARSIHAQMRLSEKAMLADHVIDNSGCWLYARLQAVHLASVLHKDFCMV